VLTKAVDIEHTTYVEEVEEDNIDVRTFEFWAFITTTTIYAPLSYK
jgi:hypothetical protein